MARFAENIVHVDVDAFFVEVERLRRPGLAGRAVLVGGDGPRSVVASASYEARRAGVRSGMPMAHSKRICPHAVVVPPDHGEYRRVSDLVMGLLESFSPRCEPVSVDEAFLDIRGLGRLFEHSRAVGEQIRAELRERVGLPASVGIATSKLIAKMASKAAKPDGLVMVAAGDELSFLRPHPVRALWGVGEATLARVEELGVSTVGDLATFPRATLERRLGAAVGGGLWDLACGRDARAVEPPGEAKSVSVEQTYETDLASASDLDRALLGHADRLASRLGRHGLAATTVHLKVRFADFTTVTRSHTFDHEVSTSRSLLAAARLLLERVDRRGRGVRLLGIGVSGLAATGSPRQLGLDDQRWESVESAVEVARRRFGRGAVSRARLVADAGSPVPDAEQSGTGILGRRSPPENPHAPR